MATWKLAKDIKVGEMVVAYKNQLMKVTRIEDEGDILSFYLKYIDVDGIVEPDVEASRLQIGSNSEIEVTEDIL